MNEIRINALYGTHGGHIVLNQLEITDISLKTKSRVLATQRQLIVFHSLFSTAHELFRLRFLQLLIQPMSRR
jgi:hypothetical protein